MKKSVFDQQQELSPLSFILFILVCNLLKSWQSHSTGGLSLDFSADSEANDTEPMLSNWGPHKQSDEAFQTLYFHTVKERGCF